MQIELDPHPEPAKPPAPTVANPYAAPRAVVNHSAATEVAIWNPNATANWSLLFTPAFGAYLQALNWEALGEPDRARNSRIWFYVTLGLVLLTIPLSLPGTVPGIGVLLGRSLVFWSLIIWYFASGKSQSRYVKERFGDDYARRSWGQPLLIGLGSVVARLVVVVMVGVVWGLMRR